MAIIGTGCVHGSSSSSSTLSPLAQPFTVNRSAPNPKSSPPPRPLIDNYFCPQDPNSTWLSDSSSHLNRDVGFAQGYAYFDSQSIGSCGTHLSSLSPSTHDFSYGEHLESIGSNVTEADPYYLQYQPETLDTNSGVMQEPGYVILNSGTSAPLEGSSQTNFIQSSTSFGIAPKWTGQWKDVDASSSWKDPKGNVDFPYRSSLQLGATPSEGFMSYEDAPAVCYGNFVESSARKDNVGLTGSGSERIYAKHLAISEVNASRPFKIPGPSVLLPSTMQETSYSHIPETSVFIPSTIEETMYSQKPELSVLVPSTIKETMFSHMPETSFRNSWNPFYQNIASYDRCFTPLDSCTTEPTIFYPSTTVPAMFCSSVTTQPVPSAGGSSSLLGKVVLKDMKSCNQPMDTSTKKDSGGQVSVNVKALTTTLTADTSKIKNDIGKYNYISMESSSAKGLPLNQKAISNNSAAVLSKNEIELKLTPLKIQEASTLTTCTDGSDYSVQSSDALDKFDSAVDSPCWKGTSSQHSSFSIFNAEPSISLAKDPEECSDFSRHGQILSINADGEASVSSPEPCGSLKNHGTRGVENPSLTMKHLSVVCSLPARPKLNAAVEKAESDSSKAGNKNGAQCSEGFLDTGNGYVLSNSPASNSGCQISDVMPLSHKDVSSAKPPLSQNTNKNPAMDFNPVQDFSPDFCSHEERACNASTTGLLPDEADEIFRASNMSNQQSVARLDVSILVKTIHSLSELLTSSHYSDASALKENDCEVICLVINNLVGLVTQLPKLITKVGSSNCIRDSTDPYKGTNGADNHLGTEAESDDGLSLGGRLRSLRKDGIMHSYFCRSRRKVDKINVVAKSDGIDFDEDVRIMQAVKKAINQNFPEEDNCPQTLLFKDLWIDAVAALCSIKYELQLARVQIEMEKSKQHQMKATDSQTSIAPGKTIGVKNILSRNDAGGIGCIVKSAAEANKGPTENTPNKSSNRKSPEMNRSDSNVPAEDGNSSSVNSKKLAQQFPPSILIGENVSSDMVSSPGSEGKFDVDMKENQMKAAGLGSIEVKKPRPSIQNQREVKYRNTFDMQMLHLGVNQTGESSGLDASEKHRMARGSRICVADEASTWPYMPDQLGNWFPNPAIGFLPSDWEHVRK